MSAKVMPRKNQSMSSSPLKKPQVLIIIVLVILLPLIIGGVYLTQNRDSDASESCAPENISAERTSQTAGQVVFNTPCTSKAQIYCSIGRDGVEFFCGEDETATTTHVIATTDVTLNADTGYYVYIDTGLDERTITYIQAHPEDATVGLNFESYDETTYGLTEDDEGYDVSKDINQDGVVNGLDRAEFYPEFSE